MSKLKKSNHTNSDPRSFFEREDDKVTIDTFDGCLHIDEHRLEEAVQEQPDLFFRVSRKLALQISRRDAAKQYLANVEADADARLRRKSAEAETKMTEKAVEAQRRLDPKVIEATEQILHLDHSVREWTALKDAVVARGHALRELVTLYSLNYWSDPSKGTAVTRMKERDAEVSRRAMNRQRRGLD